MKSRGKRARDSDADPVVLSTAPRKVAELCPPFVEDYAPYAKGQLNLTRSRQMTDCGAQWDAYYRNNTVNVKQFAHDDHFPALFVVSPRHDCPLLPI